MKTPRTSRMSTGIERVFRPMPDGLYREILLHWIHFLDENGNKVSSKLEKQIPGSLYKVVKEGDKSRSLHGEVEYTFPDGVKRRLIALGIDYSDSRYGRG